MKRQISSGTGSKSPAACTVTRPEAVSEVVRPNSLDAACSFQFIPNPDVSGLLEKERADDEGDNRDRNGVTQPGVDVARCSDNGKIDDRQQTAEDAVADVVWQRR